MQGLDGFQTAAGQKLDVATLHQELAAFIKADPNYEYRILVGSDSEVSEAAIDFVSVIVVHRVGQGARYFYRRAVLEGHLELHRRLWEEALMSLEISQALLKLVTDLEGQFRFELHLDLGTVGRSQGVVREITTLIRSYGMPYRIKPHSYAASKIADRLI